MIGWFQCKILGMHDWTSAVLEGEKATPEQLGAGPRGFFDYAKLYCRRCGEVSRRSKELIREDTDG